MNMLSAQNHDLLLEEANRCLKCKVPRCKKACPIATCSAQIECDVFILIPL